MSQFRNLFIRDINITVTQASVFLSSWVPNKLHWWKGKKKERKKEKRSAQLHIISYTQPELLTQNKFQKLHQCKLCKWECSFPKVSGKKVPCCRIYTPQKYKDFNNLFTVLKLAWSFHTENCHGSPRIPVGLKLIFLQAPCASLFGNINIRSDPAELWASIVLPKEVHGSCQLSQLHWSAEHKEHSSPYSLEQHQVLSCLRACCH